MHIFQILLIALQAWAITAAPILASRQAKTITTALGMVQTSLEKLDTAVKGLSASDPNSAVAVLNGAQGAQSALEKATSMIEGANNLGLIGALGLQQTADGVVGQVQTTLGDLTAKKPVFDQLGVTSVVSDALQQQKAGSGQLSEALLSKVPAIARPIAQQSTGQLTEALDGAIAAFSKPAAKPPAAPKPPAAAPPAAGGAAKPPAAAPPAAAPPAAA
ncbi:cell wall protein [Colletotrichum truncatum]|uniref:Cell wall protein n=1 Tax=Colletotrichum truncatum TaxID=5467 RepID=A0ACC3YPV8_COLTU|nr:cell wall protein [Colletotrichum truncatum]KAF6796804.1 cell wall protein [Colletotrichum truncatum]